MVQKPSAMNSVLVTYFYRVRIKLIVLVSEMSEF